MNMLVRVLVIATGISVQCATASGHKHPEKRRAQPQKPVILEVVALDRNGQPATDLLASDLRLSDNGKRQEVAFFCPPYVKRRAEVAGPGEYSNRASSSVSPPTVILFDLMNQRVLTDAFDRNEIVHSLEGLESSEGLYLYILNNTGGFVPIHPLPNAEAEAGTDAQWTRQIQPLLDSVLHKTGSKQDFCSTVLRGECLARRQSGGFHRLLVECPSAA